MAWVFDNDRPIYMQLTEILQGQILSGDYKPGSRLPSVRDIAASAGVNPNTVQRSMHDLEMMGLIVTDRTNGRIVSENISDIKRSGDSRKDDIIAKFLQNMKDIGYPGEMALKETAEYLKRGRSDE